MFGDSNNSKGYPIIQVGDYCDKIQVGIVIKPSKYYVQNGGVKSFRSLNVGELYVKDENWVEISLEGNRENSKSILNENDVVIVRSGNPGTSCVIPKKYSGYNAIDLIIARVNQNLCNSYYLSSFTNFEHGMKQIKEGTGGAAQQHFNVASSKDETLTIYVGFDKRYFKNLSIEDTYFYESTLKKLYYYLISTKLNRLETFEKTIVCHCQYYGISNTDAAKLIGINISDYEMLLSGKIEHINNLNRNDVLNTLGIPQEENREAFFQHLLTKIEFKDIEDVR